MARHSRIIARCAAVLLQPGGEARPSQFCPYAPKYRRERDRSFFERSLWQQGYLHHLKLETDADLALHFMIQIGQHLIPLIGEVPDRLVGSTVYASLFVASFAAGCLYILPLQSVLACMRASAFRRVLVAVDSTWGLIKAPSQIWDQNSIRRYARHKRLLSRYGRKVVCSGPLMAL